MLSTQPPAFEVQVLDSFHEVDKAQWNALNREDFPFADLDFLLSLEDGGCLGKRNGCFPKILVTYRSGRLEGALLLFLKSNSYGEYIFDWSWANAAQRAGLRYYPKLTALVPFVPATGPKFLVHPEADAQSVREILAEGAETLRAKLNCPSLHYLFTTEVETKQLEARGLLARDSFQYHWKNQSWRNFDEFLAALRSKRRSEIRRERASVRQLPLKIEAFTGAALTAEHAEWMHAFYVSTVGKMGGHAYLTADFFDLLLKNCGERVLLFLAFDSDGEPVAGALNLYEGKKLFGRHWGCRDDYKNLHFELCYYQAIDWALAHGIDVFEAGAQGEHKFSRGFQPSLTRSAHQIEHSGLSEAIADFIDQERSSIQELFREYREHDPFKRDHEEKT